MFEMTHHVDDLINILETFWTIVTRLDVDTMWDGSRVYFTEKFAGSFRLAPISAIGGQVAPVNTQIPAAYRASMAPRLTFADSRKFVNAPIEKSLLLGIKTLHTDPQLCQESQILLVSASDCELSAPPHAKHILARGPGMNLLNQCRIHEHRSVNPNKPMQIEFFRNVRDCAP